MPREESDAILPDRRVQRHSMTSLETACSLANSSSLGGGGAEGEVCMSMGGVCGRSLTGGKILFTGRQTCSLFSIMTLSIRINVIICLLETFK